MRPTLFLLVAASLHAQPAPRPRPFPPVANPAYSDEARAARLEGVANTWAEIAPDGEVVAAGLLQGLGMGLDDKAVDAVRKFKFDPAVVGAANGANVFAVIDVVFALTQEPQWRIAHMVHRFSTADRQFDPATRKVPVLTTPVLRQYTRPADSACSSGMAVSLQFPVGADGAPGDVQILAGEGDAAQAAVRSWRFDPARRNGDPTATTAEVLLKCGVPPDDGAESYRVGGGVTAPRLLLKVEPTYSEQARLARFQGTVVLYCEIGPYGYAEHMRVNRPTGLGLDVQALDAVRQWNFAPGMRGGSAVRVAANIEVNFRLL
jgi:TonB family protein